MKTIKICTLLLLLVLSLGLFSQGAVNRLFEIESNIKHRSAEFVENATYLKLNKRLGESIIQNRSDILDITIPLSSSLNVNSRLEKFEIYTDDFIIVTSKGDTIFDYVDVLTYRGRIQDMNGFISIAITDDEVIGIISLADRGDYNLGKIKDSKDEYIIYNDKDVKVDMGIECSTMDQIKDFRIDEKNNQNISSRSMNCVKVYLEGDYALYQEQNSSVNETANYMSALFSQVVTLYDNESINVQIKEIKIWTEADGYSTTSSSSALSQFRNNNLGNDANLCHLFALGGDHIGGVAWVDVLCNDSYKFAYSNISNYYNEVPTYSWSVECVTHEMGHNLGASHTHDCVWGANNDEQIDDCGSVQGYVGGDCYDENNPILPPSGTIMSYCHLVSDVGIDFNNGFGTEPGDLIRNRVNSASCLSECSGGDCGSPINFTVVNISTNSAEMEWSNSNNESYEIEYGDVGFSHGEGTIITDVNTDFYTVEGLNPGVKYDCYLRKVCSDNSFSTWTSVKQFRTECVSQIEPVVLPYFQGWEDDDGYVKEIGRFSCSNVENWYFETDRPGFGRLKYGIQCPDIMVISGTGALIMDRKPYGDLASNAAILTLNMSNYTYSDDLKLKFSYRDKSDESQENDKIWMRGSEFDSWIEAYYLDPGSIQDGVVTTVEIDIDSVLGIGGQYPSESFQIKFGQEDDYAYGSDGIAFDDIEITGSEVLEAPFFEDFAVENDNWEVEDVNNDGRLWSLLSNDCDPSSIGIETSSMMCMMNDWLYSPKIYLTQGVSYSLSFNLNDNGDSEKLEVYLSPENNSISALDGQLLFKDEAISNNGCSGTNFIFEPSQTGNYYLAFHNYSTNCMSHSLLVDDFEIKEVDSGVAPEIQASSDNSVEEYIANGVAGNVWHYIKSGDKIVAAINPLGQDLGKVTVELRDGGAVESYMIENRTVKTIPRYFNFESVNEFSENILVRLYIDESDLIDYNNADPETSDVISELQINHYDGLLENCYFNDNENNGILIEESEITTDYHGSYGYYFEFYTSSFSEFLIHQNVNSTLPIKYDVNAYLSEDNNIIELFTSVEIGISEYILQAKETNGIWVNIESRIANNRNNSKYKFVDKNPSGEMYYRVLIRDENGIEEYTKVLYLYRDSKRFSLENVYPNPSNGVINLSAHVTIGEEVEIEICNMLGKQVYQEKMIPTNDEYVKELDMTDLKQGVYLLSITQDTEKSVRKVYLNTKFND